MANIVDVDNAPGNLDELESSLREAVVEEGSKAEEPEPEPTPEPQNADPLAGTKFEGKSLEDILDSYNNLQSAYGRMANDLGTQRKLTDRLLDLKRSEDLESNAPEPYQITGAELLDNPTKALDDVLTANNARVTGSIEEKLQNLEAQLQQDRFMQKHPDVMTLGQDEAFLQWTQDSPIKAQLAQKAAAGDWDAADALLTEYKSQPKPEPTPQPDDSAALEEARKAQLESTNQASDEAASKGKVYRRADMIDLKINKPHVWSDPAFQQEILKAYAEGRVK